MEPIRLLTNYKTGQKSTHQNTKFQNVKSDVSKLTAAVDWKMFVVVYLVAGQVLRNGIAEFVELVAELHLFVPKNGQDLCLGVDWFVM